MSNYRTVQQPDGSINVLGQNGKFIKKIRKHLNLSDIDQMGFFGNVWVRSHSYAKAGDTNGGGHKHNFDHVTLLAVGSVLVEVEGQEPKVFEAPTFIVIDKDHKHKFTALTDGVVYYCVFALRDVDGNVLEMYDPSNSPMDHTPFEARITDDNLEKLRAES